MPLSTSLASVVGLMMLLAQPAGMSWTLPAGWTTVPGERPMRVATLKTAEATGSAEVSITQFGGDVGGQLANINRWRGQIGLAPVSQAELKDLIKPFEIEGFKGYIVRLKGEKQSILAAGLFETAENRTWFVKIQGTEEQVEKNEKDFTDFVKSFKKK